MNSAARNQSHKRKIRKGTTSCWECKRRKSRCTFSSPNDKVCAGCHLRGKPCIGQDLPQDAGQERRSKSTLAQRIARLENAIDHHDTNHESRSAERLAAESTDGKHTKAQGDASPLRNDLNRNQMTKSPARNLSPASSTYCGRSNGDIDAIRHQLLAAFPSAADTQELLNKSTGLMNSMHLIHTRPNGSFVLAKLRKNTSTQPFHRGPTTHPVALARQLIMFAIAVQNPCDDPPLQLEESRDILMSRFMGAAETSVTRNEDMWGTIDCLVCIVMESVFETHCGDLRRAWMANRRAISAAQSMGLHRSPMPTVKQIDQDLDVDAQSIWYRIVYMDRYLSLLLNLPNGTPHLDMSAMGSPDEDTPLAKFEQLLTATAARILERNERPFEASEWATTKSIDSVLIKASESMPIAFWKPANFDTLKYGMPETVLETLRLGVQVYYYGLLIHLHLPFMIQIGNAEQQPYSKMVCAYASHEILANFVAHRRFNPFSSCSRPVDFFALQAAMALLLAHLDAHHQPGIPSVLSHQRHGDRALLDQVLEQMDVLRDVRSDRVAKRSAKVIRSLMATEADAADGSTYVTRPLKGNWAMDEGSDENEEANTVCLRIPYLGLIKVARLWTSQTCSKFANGDSTSANLGNANSPERSTARTSTTLQLNNVTSLEPTLDIPDRCDGDVPLSSEMGMASDTVNNGTDLDDWTLEGVDTAFFDSLMRGMPDMDFVSL